MRMIWEIFSVDVRNLFKNVIAAIVVMGLALVPPMYAWFTTLGFWSPYDNTGNIEVAVASQDEGYASDLLPSRINAGDQIIAKLRANDKFDWQFVSADEAVAGVRSGEYYAALVIPKEFSADLMTVFSDDIAEPKIVYYDNEKENAIAQRVTSTGANTLQETIDETFTETVASVALDTTSSLTSFMSGEGILAYGQSLGDRLDEAIGEVEAAADQAGAYADLVGSTDSLVAATGSILKEAADAPDETTPLVSEARDGLAGAQDGPTSAADAAQKALDAADASYDAVSQAADGAFDTMKKDPVAAAEVLGSTASDVQSLQQAYQSMRDTLAAADPSSPALAVLDRVIAQLETLEGGLQAAEAAIGKDAATLDEEHQKVTDIIGKGKEALDASKATYNDQLKGELEGLSASLQKVGDDTSTLAASLQSTAAGLGDSTDSLGASLHAAEESLRKTADTLRAAADQLTQARDDLHQALNTGDIDEVRRIIGNNPAAIAQFIAAPTKLEQHTVYPMADNGSAMSPFYTSLCLWIGAIFMVALMSVTVSPARQQALSKKFGRAPRPAELYLGRYGVFGLIGLARGARQRVLPRRGMRASGAVPGRLLPGFRGIHEPRVYPYRQLRQHRQGHRHHRAGAAAGRLRWPHARADAVGAAVRCHLPLAALRPFYARAGRSHGRHLWQPVPRANGTAGRLPRTEPHSGSRLAPPRHAPERLGARQTGRDEVPVDLAVLAAVSVGYQIGHLDSGLRGDIGLGSELLIVGDQVTRLAELAGGEHRAVLVVGGDFAIVPGQPRCPIVHGNRDRQVGHVLDALPSEVVDGTRRALVDNAAVFTRKLPHVLP